MEKQKLNFITCPTCEGSGKNKYGMACGNCGGVGIGAFYSGVFYYWGPQLGLAVIKLSRLKKRINQLVDLLAFFVGLAGVFFIGWWLYENSGGGLADLFFWRFRHWLILFFWVSLIFDMFVIYRLSEAEAAKKKIKKLNYKPTSADEVPNNWIELKKFKRKIDVSQGFGEAATAVVEEAFVLAKNLKQPTVGVMHLFFSLFKDNETMAFFSRLNISRSSLLKKINSRIKATSEGKGKTELSALVKKVFIESYISALDYGQKKVKPLNMILPCHENDKVLAEILYDFEIEKNKIINCFTWFLINEKQVERYQAYRKMARFKPANNMDRAYTSVATPVLDHFAYDLTVAAKWGRLEFVVAREEEINAVFQHFKSGRTGVVLNGEKGVGKNAVIEGIAQLMVEEDVPDMLHDKRLVKLDAARLISGATASQAQERLLVIIDEIIRAGNIILYIPDIENIVGITSGTEESLDLSEVLAGAIERRSILCLATATTQNYIKYIEETPLGSIMAGVKIEEPKGDKAIQIIESKIGQMEGKYKVYFSYNAIEEVIKLSNKYIHTKYLPDKAIELLELVSVKVAESRGQGAVVNNNDIAEAVSIATNIPVAKVTARESDVLLNLEEKIHKRMINQVEAVNMVADSLRRARAELHQNKRPIASFLFLGPTGVGKTELAKTVADIYFGNENNMIRVDMSEYQSEGSIEKMIGNADGGKGYLTEAVRKAPFSLILLDEFEKAHGDILNLFLQVMDDGRLTDGQGRTIDFTNAIIISTSNADAVYIQDEVGRGTSIEVIKDVIMNERLNKIMRPELINRFDGIIVFKPLSQENVLEIARLMIAKFGKMLEDKGIRMRAEEDGIAILAREGYDPKFGARPMRRLLQDKIENIIANKILSGELKRRDTVVINANAEVLVEKGEVL